MVRQNLLGIVERIIGLDQSMRFASIIDLNGNIIEGIMKSGKTSLESQKQEENFCKQVAQRRKMRKEFDKSLGKVRYVHVEREKVTQFDQGMILQGADKYQNVASKSIPRNNH